MSSPFSFPRVVDEVTVRLVAAQVLVVSTLAVATGWLWLFGLLAVDFALRVAFGPRSPLAQVALRVLRPLVPAAPRPTAGPPKRFAASIGIVCSVLVVLFAYPLGWTVAAWVVAAMMVLFPLLESALRAVRRLRAVQRPDAGGPGARGGLRRVRRHLAADPPGTRRDLKSP